MRPPRVIIAAVFFLATVFLTFLSLRSSHGSHTIKATSPASQNGLQSFFSFKVPFSLFPPNAIITLTYENSTAFLARPAAFGPSLPADGLKGQVWIGSGFGDDSMHQGAIGTSAEGELGCSDVPGWVESYAKSSVRIKEANAEDAKVTTGTAKSQKVSNEKDGPFARSARPETLRHRNEENSHSTVDDGTDDYLHHPLSDSTVSKTTRKDGSDTNENHADIQSLQEGAEIAGKIVLLSRGGCGFLEKVKWAQRRGAIAVIVGDDIKGGSLFQMYARGDTSNVTIPSVFTSRTTAHLLSSLVESEGFVENSIDENGNQILNVQRINKPKKLGKKHSSNPTFTPSTSMPKSTTIARTSSKAHSKKGSSPTKNQVEAMTTQRPGWFKSLFGFSSGKSQSDSSRPPSSGRLDWVLVDDWKDDDKISHKKSSARKPDVKAGADMTVIQKNKAGDDFVIGVQDWRDPDLVGAAGKDNDPKAQGAKIGEESDVTKTKSSPRPVKTGKKHIGGALQDIPEYIPALRGGSITPGSGEYGEKDDSYDETLSKGLQQNVAPSDEKSKGLLNAIFGDDEEDVDFSMGSTIKPKPAASQTSEEDEDEDDDDEYDGLWVTLTPTSGASPFLDTLLVLVVSPLVTLTVVYALLLVRSRIRRRRWRAPKSVVERLPVRTYQTIATPGNQSPRLPTSTGSSTTTPLLQHSPSTTSSRPRPRSRTTTGIPGPGDLIQVNSAPLQVPVIPPHAPEHEKNSSVSSEWKKYMGKQVECVVCLEEYIDGVSRVMSLPCGHEFHSECIIPWLTTRRRTCPICKGDVVRSLARGSPSNPHYEAYHDDSDNDVQSQAAESVNNLSSSALPIPHSNIDADEGDLEQGTGSLIPTRQRGVNQPGSWRSILATSLGSSSQRPQRQQEDRDR